MTDDLRKEMENIRQKVDALTDHDIDMRWDIGQQLNTIKDDKTGKYGSHPEKLMKAVMPLSRDGLRPMMVLAKTYSQDDLKRLMTLRNSATQERLTWSHVIALTRVKDKNKAYGLAEKAVSKGWTSRDLNKAVIDASGGPRSSGGKPPKKAANLEAAAADIEAKAQAIRNTAVKSWMAEGGLADLFAEAAIAWPNKKAPQAVIDYLEKATSGLEDAVVTMKQVIHQLNALQSQARATRAPRQPVA